MVVKNRLDAVVEPLFVSESYGYRPKKSALDAVAQARQMCWDYDWVCDLDIKGFFDNLDHDLMMRAVRKHAKEKWVELYVERWLKAPAQDEDGQVLERDRGTPQGGVSSHCWRICFCTTRLICGCDGNGRICRSSGMRTTSLSIAEQSGYTFRPRKADGRKGKIFCRFSPAISKDAAQKIPW